MRQQGVIVLVLTLLLCGCADGVAPVPHALAGVPLANWTSADYGSVDAVHHDPEREVCYVAYNYYNPEGKDRPVHRFEIFDTRNPSNLTSLWVSPPGEEYSAFAQDGTVLYGMGAEAVVMWNVSNPSSPQKMKVGGVSGSEARSNGEVLGVVGAEGVAFLSKVTLDELSRVEVTPFWLEFRGNTAYVAGAGQVAVVDVANATQPKVVAKLTGFDPWRVVVDGDVLYAIEITGLLRVYDVSTGAPALTGSLSPNVSCNYVHEVAVSSNTLYVTWGYCGVQVIDVSNPAAPKLTGHFYPTKDRGLADKIAVHGGFGYLGNGVGGFTTAFLHPDPTPSPKPRPCEVCGPDSTACCDPKATPAQLCPGGHTCCDCGKTACACPRWP